MHFAPSSLDVVWVSGYGATPPVPIVTVSRADGSEVPIAAGHHPGWIARDEVLFCPPEDGYVQYVWLGHTDEEGQDFVPPILAGNTLTASAGKVAVHRTDPRRVLTSWGWTLDGETDPVLSAGGLWLATIVPDVPAPQMSTLRCRDTNRPPIEYFDISNGAPTRPRFSHTGSSLTWEGGGGQIYGIADVANPSVPVVRLSRPDDRLYHPVPLWVPERGELFVLAVQDWGTLGALTLASWGSCEARSPVGWQVGLSKGSAFDLAVCSALDTAELAWLSPSGKLVRVHQPLSHPRIPLPLPPKPPDPEPTPPDIPWTTDPHGVVEDIAAWIFAPDQGPDVHFSPDGAIRFFCKSDEVSGDGKDPHIGEHWDVSDALDDFNIGHLDDASTGRRILDGKEVIAEDIVRMFPETHAAVWASLAINHNSFADGARLWLPRRCVSGTRIRYVTDITWTVPPRETPHTRVWKNIPIEIRVDVGYARINGKEARVRGSYVPDGHPEVNYYGEPKGYNAWIAGPFGSEDHWS